MRGLILFSMTTPQRPKSIFALSLIALFELVAGTAFLHAQSFENGTHIVGRDVSPGTYRTAGATYCYWERLNSFTGDFTSIIANGVFDGVPGVVTIKPSDKGFTSQDCGTWRLVTQRPGPQFANFDNGTYIVGIDIRPGTYRTTGGSHCYWERLSGFSGDADDLLANDILENRPGVVTVKETDKGFSSQDCDGWTLIPDAPDGGTTQSHDPSRHVSPSLPANPKIYWMDIGARLIQRANLDGTDVETLVATRSRAIGWLSILEEKMYWWSTDGLHRANLDGTGVEELVSGSVQYYWLVGNRMYWWAPEHLIKRANLDGSAVEVVSTDRELKNIIGDEMYWLDSTDGELQRSGLDATSFEDLVRDPPIGYPFLIDAGKIYWQQEKKIWRFNLDGSELEILATDAWFLHFAEDRIYWLTIADGVVQRSNLDGSDVETLVKQRVRSFRTSRSRMYWSVNGEIWKAGLEGTNAEVVVEGLLFPSYLVLYVPPD